MSIVDQINKAIAAHGMWKVRLRQAVHEGKSEFTVARVSVDNQCDFGKWLYSLPPTDHQSPSWKKVHDAHAKFHKEAAHVLELALSGSKAEAESGLGNEAPFTKISVELTGAMMEWKKTAE
jgi:hypothetical protein